MPHVRVCRPIRYIRYIRNGTTGTGTVNHQDSFRDAEAFRFGHLLLLGSIRGLRARWRGACLDPRSLGTLPLLIHGLLIHFPHDDQNNQFTGAAAIG